MAKMTPSIVCLAGVLVLGALPAFSSDTTYHDPRNPSFSMMVPDGWTAKRTNSGLNLSHGNSAVILTALTGSRDPKEMVADIVGQIQAQAKSFREMEKGPCRFGGQPGAYDLFSSVGPNGMSQVMKVIAMTNGQLSYTMIQEIRADDYEDEKRDLQRIQDSFAPEALATAKDDKEKLDALYAAGVISQEEYQARKRNLGGSPSPEPSASVSPSTGAVPAVGESPRPTKTVPVAPTEGSNETKPARTIGSAQVQRYAVVHFALSKTMNWMTDNCVGWMTIDNGVISYRAVKGTHGLHSFDIPVTSIKEAKRNTLMGSAFQAFHIRLKNGENHDFSLLDNSGQQIQNPAILLDAIHAAMP